MADHHKIPIYVPYQITNSPSVLDAISGGWVSSQGSYLTKVQDKIKQMLNIPYVVMNSNGTTATHCVVLALRMKYPNITRIYVPNNVYVAAINSVLFEYNIDVIKVLPIDYNTLNFDLGCLSELESNSALLIVHNVGRVIDVPYIKKVRPDLAIIEDACEVFMANYPNSSIKAGTLAIAASFSFYANKTVTSGEGGAFITHDKEIYDYIKLICHQGQGERRYLHNILAYNYRMTNIQAALLYDQLVKFDSIVALKRSIFERYHKNLGLTQYDSNVFWMFCCKIPNDVTYDEIESEFTADNIEIRPMFYPITDHKHLTNLSLHDPDNSKVARKVNQDYFMFPSYPDLSTDQVDKVCKTIQRCMNKYNRISYETNPSEKNIRKLIDSLQPEELSTFRYYNKREIQASMKNHIITVLLNRNDSPIGYGHLDRDKDKTWLGIVIRKEFQGLGFGRKIMEMLISEAKNSKVDCLWLTVDKSNVKAKSLYEKFGFTLYDSTNDHYDMYSLNIVYPDTNSIDLPVSIGEALDKHTILKIKLEYIKDKSKLEHVECEYSVLSQILDPAIQKFPFYYKQLLNINKKIWILQDDFRDQKTEPGFTAQEIIKYNDARFRLKNKINILTNSRLKEQKGYKDRTAVVFSPTEYDDILNLNGAIRYWSIHYDKIIIVTHDMNKKIYEQMYSDDPSIILHGTDNISLEFSDKGYDIFDASKCDHDPEKLYADMGLDFSVFTDYMYIAE